jgi:hypothetical protein
LLAPCMLLLAPCMLLLAPCMLLLAPCRHAVAGPMQACCVIAACVVHDEPMHACMLQHGVRSHPPRTSRDACHQAYLYQDNT